VPDLAVRIALGAPPAAIRRRVLSGSLLRAVAGGAIGMAVAAAASGTLRTFIFGVQPVDPIVELGVIVLLATAGIVGALGPARRAVHVDAIQVLRQI
jgi:ABC-type antimicrobial peptide transport system permease subunit